MTIDSEGSTSVESSFPARPTEYSRAGAEWFRDTVRTLAQVHHPLIGSFPRAFVEEFPDFDDEQGDEPESVGFRQFVHQYEMHVSLDTTLAFDVGAVLAHADELGDNLGRQQSRDMIQMLSDAATASGNVVSLDPVEQYIAGLMTAEIEFDEAGKHNMQLVATEEFLQQLSSHPPTPEQQDRIDAIFAAKKEAQDARRNNRRLP